MATKALITTPFGFDSTAMEVVAGVDLRGRRAVVTGGASGIGVETARALASAGAAVTLAVRDLDAGARTAADITGTTGNPAVTVARLDLADLSSVDAFAAQWDGPLHMLVNNAGVMAIQELTLTPRGHEMQFATNHLGHLALAIGLHDALATADDARVVAVSSSAHMRSPIVWDDIHFGFRTYEPWSAYGQSKTANVLFAVEAQRRWGADGITINALMPGGIATNLQRHVGGPEYMRRVRSAAKLPIKSVEQGAATSVLLATSPLLEGIGGRYFEDCQEATSLLRREDPTQHAVSDVAWFALDGERAERLWAESLEMIGR